MTLEAVVDFPPDGALRHSLVLADQDGRPVVADERVEPVPARSEDELAKAQNVGPLDVRAVFGKWPGDADDDFEAAIDELRRPGRRTTSEK